jgi:hypothetical protein
MVQCAARGQVILKRLWSAWRQWAISSKASRDALPILVGIAGLILWPLAATQASVGCRGCFDLANGPDYRNRHRDRPLQTHHHGYGKPLAACRTIRIRKSL